MVLLIEVYYNRYNTIFTIMQTRFFLQGALIHTALYTGTTHIYNTSTDRLQYRYITLHYITLHYITLHYRAP